MSGPSRPRRVHRRRATGPAVPAGGADAGPLEERELTALWLLGRVPTVLLPDPVLRPGRAGRGPGPDVREAAVVLESGVVACGDVEVHLRASDFVHHGHAADPAYAGVLLHLVWEDDRPLAERGRPTPVPLGGMAHTVAVGPVLGHDAERLRARLRRGPAGGEPCAPAAAALGPEATRALVRAEGRCRLAERAWRAARLAAELGWEGAWAFLLDRALRSSAGRRREDAAARAGLAAAVNAGLGPATVARLADLAVAGEPSTLIDALRVRAGPGGTAVPGIGRGRAAELGWNAALPLLMALAAAYDRGPLARATARLADRWPAPRPYGRTRALAGLLGARAAHGALYSQGLLHLQELWCERGGCGQCPCSRPPPAGPVNADDASGTPLA